MTSNRYIAVKNIYENLVELNEKGLHQGGVSLDDVLYDRNKNKVTFLNWSNYSNNEMHYINDVEVRGLYSNQNPAKIQAEEETTNLLCFG